MQKSRFDDVEGRIREAVSDPNNKYIPRHKNAGKIIDGYLIMHNGLKVVPGMFGEISKVFEVNKGVHEPQEERIFTQVLPYIPESGVMVELGAYWSFYSMWFYKEVKNARCYMIEPDKEFLAMGKKNFELNNMRGDFRLGHIGNDGLKIDNFLEVNGIEYVDILDSDIQGAGFEMLLGAEKSIIEGKIKHFFISSHSQELHYKCLDFLKRHKYIILASADFDRQTYCHDGVLVARLAAVGGLKPVDIALASWDTNDFINDTINNMIPKVCPYKLLPKFCLFCYYHRDRFILPSKILPKAVRKIIKKILRR